MSSPHRAARKNKGDETPDPKRQYKKNGSYLSQAATILHNVLINLIYMKQSI